MDLTGMVVIITGASSGIGEATARLLAQKRSLLMRGSYNKKYSLITPQLH